MDGALIKLDVSLASEHFRIPLALQSFPRKHFASKMADESLNITIRNIATRIYNEYERMPDETLLPAGLAQISQDVFIAMSLS